MVSKSTLKKFPLTAMAWAGACDMRKAISSLRVQPWPEDGLTRAERKIVSRINGYLEEAERDVCRLQGSLSERSKMQGEDFPTFQAYRDWRDQVRS